MVIRSQYENIPINGFFNYVRQIVKIPTSTRNQMVWGDPTYLPRKRGEMAIFEISFCHARARARTDGRTEAPFIFIALCNSNSPRYDNSVRPSVRLFMASTKIKRCKLFHERKFTSSAKAAGRRTRTANWTVEANFQVKCRSLRSALALSWDCSYFTPATEITSEEHDDAK